MEVYFRGLMTENPTFQAIEETRETLGNDWLKHWSEILKPEIIVAYILSKEGNLQSDDDLLKLCRLTYSLIEEVSAQDKKEHYNELVERVVEKIK